jgi:hypothetical protein
MSCTLVSAWCALFKVAPSIDKRAERRGIRVVTQTLIVRNGDQKEIERQGIGSTALNIVIPVPSPLRTRAGHNNRLMGIISSTWG